MPTLGGALADLDGRRARPTRSPASGTSSPSCACRATSCSPTSSPASSQAAGVEPDADDGRLRGLLPPRPRGDVLDRGLADRRGRGSWLAAAERRGVLRRLRSRRRGALRRSRAVGGRRPAPRDRPRDRRSQRAAETAPPRRLSAVSVVRPEFGPTLPELLAPRHPRAAPDRPGRARRARGGGRGACGALPPAPGGERRAAAGRRARADRLQPRLPAHARPGRAAGARDVAAADAGRREGPPVVRGDAVHAPALQGRFDGDPHAHLGEHDQPDAPDDPRVRVARRRARELQPPARLRDPLPGEDRRAHDLRAAHDPPCPAATRRRTGGRRHHDARRAVGGDPARRRDRRRRRRAQDGHPLVPLRHGAPDERGRPDHLRPVRRGRHPRRAGRRGRGLPRGARARRGSCGSTSGRSSASSARRRRSATTRARSSRAGSCSAS